MKTVLVVDDELSMQRLLKLNLESAGYTVETAATSADAFTMAASHPEYSAILLDLGLPDGSGIDALARMRKAEISTPVIVVTVVDDDVAKVKALDLGADDYVTKPFSAPELLARVRVAIRHASPALAAGAVIRVGPLEIDIANHQVRANGVEIKLTPIEFRILVLLGENLGRVVTHRVLLKQIWGPNAVEHVQYLRVHLGQIRKKLSKHGVDDLLATESGVGYRLLIPDDSARS